MADGTVKQEIKIYYSSSGFYHIIPTKRWGSRPLKLYGAEENVPALVHHRLFLLAL